MSIQSRDLGSGEAAVPSPVGPRLPPLETGDRLTRAEFERRYDAMPDLKKAELVDGEVYVGSPTLPTHGYAHAHLVTLLTLYAARTTNLVCADNTTVRLDMDNEVQPDALLRVATGGRSQVGSDRYIEGPPELVAEVSLTSVSRDLHSKLALYRRHGIPEYIVWRTYDSAIDWFRMVEGEYQPQSADELGVVHSAIFPGLWLNIAALVSGDINQALATLEQGLASDEHARFLAPSSAH